MKRAHVFRKTFSSILAAALTLGSAAPSYARGGQELAAGNGAASDSRSHALKPEAKAEQTAGLEELKDKLRQVADAAGWTPQTPLSSSLSAPTLSAAELKENSQVRWGTMVAKATGFSEGWTGDHSIKAQGLVDRLVIESGVSAGTGNRLNVIETIRGGQYTLSVSNGTGQPITRTSSEPIIQDIQYETVNAPNARRVLTIFVPPQTLVPQEIIGLTAQADRFGSPQDVTIRIASAAGLKEWGGGPNIRLYPVGQASQDHRFVIYEFDPAGTQIWGQLQDWSEPSSARLAITVTDSSGQLIPPENAIVLSTQVLYDILVRLEAAERIPAGDVKEIWLEGQGRVDFKNPKTLATLRLDAVKEALAENKKAIVAKRQQPGTTVEQTKPLVIALRGNVDTGNSDNVVFFSTAGDDRSQWGPIAEVFLGDTKTGTAQVIFSALRNVRIDRESVYERRRAAGLEEPGIGSLPATHQIDYHFSGQFLSGRIPTEEDAAQLLGTRGIPHAQLATEWIGVVTVLEDLIGAGRGLDTVQKRGIVDRADIRAQEIQDQVARAQGVLLQHVNFETKGLTPGGLQAGAVGGDPKGKPTPTISDVIEHTAAFVEGEPGASSMQMEGPGVETFGSFPDEARALMVVTHTDPSKEAAVLRQHGVQTVDEFLDPELSVDQLVRRVAELNGVHSNQVDVTLLTNDEADLEALENLQQTYTGLRVHPVKAGTVAPSLAAVLGVNDGRVRLFLRRSGMTEGVFITLLAGLYSADGSYANFRVVSEEIKSEFARRYLWNQRVLEEMKALRPNDWTEIRDGKKIFSSRQATLPVTGVYTFLTNGRTDLDLPFSIDGVRQDGGVSTISSLVFTSHPINRGAGYLWLSRNSYTLPAPEVHPAGLEEGLKQAQRNFSGEPRFFQPLPVDAKPKSAVVVNLAKDERLANLAWALAIMQVKQPGNSPLFRVVVEEKEVNPLLKKWVTFDRQALPQLTELLVVQKSGERNDDAVRRAIAELEREGLLGSTQVRVQEIDELTLDLAETLRVFFTTGGLNFLTDPDAFAPFKALLEAA